MLPSPFPSTPGEGIEAMMHFGDSYKLDFMYPLNKQCILALITCSASLLLAGSAVSLKTTNSLLDLLCFYGDREPVRDYLPDKEMTEEFKV